MPEDTFAKNPQETWIIAIKRMVWITFLWLAIILTSIYTLCIGNLEDPLCIWILSSSVFICVFFIIMSFRKSGYGRLKCYMLCVLFLQFGIYWTFTIMVNNLQLTTFAILSTLIVVIFAKAANNRDVSTGATGATRVAPKFSDTLTLFQPWGADSAHHRIGRI